MLPTESAVAKARRPLGINDLKLANRVGPSLWSRVPLLGFELENKPSETEYDDWRAEREQETTQVNGHVDGARTDDEMDVDDDEFDWDAEGYGDRDMLDSLLDDCLAMPA